MGGRNNCVERGGKYFAVMWPGFAIGEDRRAILLRRGRGAVASPPRLSGRVVSAGDVYKMAFLRIWAEGRTSAVPALLVENSGL
jgi:hypothetical protein